MASPALSQASTAFETDAPQLPDEQNTTKRYVLLRRAKEVATSQDVLLFLIALRILNALSIRTFFQPDEYFQSLEPAWEIAFGANSGAWITWVSSFISQLIRRVADRSLRSGRITSGLQSTQPSLLPFTASPPKSPMSCDSLLTIAPSFCSLPQKLHRPSSPPSATTILGSWVNVSTEKEAVRPGQLYVALRAS